MEKAKQAFKLVGLVLIGAGAVLFVLGNLSEIRALIRKVATCKARREEMKDYAD